MKGAPKATPARGRPKSNGKTTMKGVVIPPSSVHVSPPSGRRVLSSQSPESSDSWLSSPGDHFSDYETPGTSAIMTPAESLTKREPLSKMFSKMTGGNDDAQITETGVSSKRKRSHADDDALLAQTLQEEEYQMDKSGEGIVKRRRIEDPPSLADRNEELRSGKERRTLSKSARESDKIFIKAEAAREITDTDSDDFDDSELSEYISEEDLDDLAESEANEDNSSAYEPSASANARSRPASRGRGRGRRSLPASTRPHQQQTVVTPAPPVESWRSRRIARVSWHKICLLTRLLTLSRHVQKGGNSNSHILRLLPCGRP